MIFQYILKQNVQCLIYSKLLTPDFINQKSVFLNLFSHTFLFYRAFKVNKYTINLCLISLLM